MSQPQPDAGHLLVDMEPVGRRIEVEPGTTLLAAAQSAGVGIVSLCGGEGWCESCIVRVVEGNLSPPTTAEEDILTAEELAGGLRMACQARALGDVRIDIPPESLSAPQRLQVEGQRADVALDPPVRTVDVTLSLPTLHDLRSDATRLEDALAEQGISPVTIGWPLLADLSDRLRAYDWSARLALRRGEIVAVLPPETRLLGLAVDIGTTKMAAYLLDLATGVVLAQRGAMNPQIAYGEDVISRIAYANHEADGRRTLQQKVVEALNGMVAEMCGEVGQPPEHVVEAVVVGNTAMHHLFAGLPVRQLALAPYVPAVSEALDMRAYDLGLELASGARVHLLPNIAGYVGADHVAMILATGIWQFDEPAIALDIGTNTEITLAVGDRLLSCSCASGPAFEGAHIRAGMRAAAGAVERIRLTEDDTLIYTIDDAPPVGICGSGILDAVAEMHSAGIIGDTGALIVDHPQVRAGGDGQPPEFVLVPAEKTGHGRDITITRSDVNEIQLAKAAIRAGIDILLAEAGIAADEIQTFIVAGAFGTYIDVPNAIRVGMFPDIPVERFRQVGNAAGMGAQRVLLSDGQQGVIDAFLRRVEYVELTTHPEFQRHFLSAMYL
jgi:uncharacterized 2Fe-2S/4Fe-4S cluster protein (DUF4445 family)